MAQLPSTFENGGSAPKEERKPELHLKAEGFGQAKLVSQHTSGFRVGFRTGCCQISRRRSESDDFIARPSSRSSQVLPQGLTLQFSLPAREDQRRYSVPNHVDQGSEHAQEAVDSENQRHACNRNGWNHRERGHKRDERCTLHAAGALGSKHRYGENGELLGQSQMSVSCLRHE